MVSSHLAETLSALETSIFKCRSILGHDGQSAQLLHQYKENQFHHAWLFHGPTGVGKASLAVLMAKFMFQFSDHSSLNHETIGFDQIDHNHQMVNLIEHNAHPDVYYLQKKTDPKTAKVAAYITVNEMRAMKRFLSTTPSFNSWRIVIIDKIDHCNIQALNSLLKILEEPPKNTVFFVISDVPGRLPITIRSRCCRLKFNNLNLSAFKDVYALFRADASEEDYHQLFHLSGGAPGYGLELASAGGLSFYNLLITILMESEGGNPGLLFGLLDQLNQSAKHFDMACQIYLNLTGRLMKYWHYNDNNRALGINQTERTLADHLVKVTDGTIKFDIASLLKNFSIKLQEVKLYNLDKKAFFLEKLLALQGNR